MGNSITYNDAENIRNTVKGTCITKHLFDFLDLLVQTTDHFIGGIWNFLNTHQAHERVDLVGQNFVQHIRVMLQSHASGSGALSRLDVFSEINNIFALRLNLHHMSEGQKEESTTNLDQDTIFAHHLHYFAYK